MKASQWLQTMWLPFPLKSVRISWASTICTGSWSSTCRIWRPLNFLENPQNGLFTLMHWPHYLFLISLTTRTLLSSGEPTDSPALSFYSCQMNFSSSRTLDERGQLSLEDSESLWASGRYLTFEASMTKCFLPITPISRRGEKRLEAGSPAPYIPFTVALWVQRKAWFS